MNTREKIVFWCDRIMFFAMCSIIYFLPISIALIETFTVIALVAYLVKRSTTLLMVLKTRDWLENNFLKRIKIVYETYRPIPDASNWVVWVLLGINFLSVIFSQYPGVSLNGFLGKSLQDTFLYFNFIEAVNSKKRLRIFMFILLISVSVIGCDGLFQKFMGHEFIFGNNLQSQGERIFASFRSPNDFAAYLVVMLFILFGLLKMIKVKPVAALDARVKPDKEIFANPWIMVWTFILYFISIVCLGYAFSRGAWFAWALILIVFTFKNKKLLFINILTVALFLFCFYPKLVEARKVGLVYDFVYSEDQEVREEQIRDINRFYKKTNRQHLSELFPEGSFMNESLKKYPFLDLIFGSGRGGYWQEAYNIFKDHPWIGTGINTYSLMGMEYKISWGGYPHNCYLQMLAETGVLGVGAFFLMIGLIYKRSIEAYRRIENQFLQTLLWGVLAGLTGFLIHSSLDTFLYSVQLGCLFWVLLALIVVVQRLGQPIRF